MNIKPFFYQFWRQPTAQQSWLLRSALSGLCPLAWLYGQIAQTRRSLYRRGILPSFSAPVPVVSVGNITVGGVGKTPFTLYLAQLYARWGEKPAILIRGYGRTAREPMIITPENFDPLRVCEYGDEAAWLAFTSGLPIGIGGDRKQVMELLLKTVPCTRILLDDGFQHRRLRRNLDLVMLDGGSPLGNAWCLPYGPLREPVGALRDADALIIHGEKTIADGLDLPQNNLDFFYGNLQWTALRPFTDWMRKQADRDLRPDEFNHQTVTLVSGIGNPDRFERQAKQHGLLIKKHWAFPDHHWYTETEIRQFLRQSSETNILTTEKDAIRWLPFPEMIRSEKTERIYVVCAGWVMQAEERWMEWLQNR